MPRFYSSGSAISTRLRPLALARYIAESARRSSVLSRRRWLPPGARWSRYDETPIDAVTRGSGVGVCRVFVAGSKKTASAIAWRSVSAGLGGADEIGAGQDHDELVAAVAPHHGRRRRVGEARSLPTFCSVQLPAR